MHFVRNCKICNCNIQNQEYCDLFNSQLETENDTIKLSYIFIYVTNLKITPDDGLSRVICMECIGRLEDAYVVKLQAETTQKSMLQILQHLNKKSLCSAKESTTNMLEKANIDISDIEISNHYSLKENKAILNEQGKEICLEEEKEKSEHEAEVVKDHISLVAAEEPEVAFNRLDDSVDVEIERNDAVIYVDKMSLGTRKQSISKSEKTHIRINDMENNNSSKKNKVTQNGQEKEICFKKREEDSECDVNVTKDDISFVDVEELETNFNSLPESVHDENATNDAVLFLTRHYNSQMETTNLNKTKSCMPAIKRHKCEICNRKFQGKSNLVDHLRLHANVKLFHCNYCDKSFVQIANYRTHLRTHTNERPYACHLCFKTYNQSGSLKIHIRSHTNERTYKCIHCDKSFTNASDLNKHKRLHDPSKHFKCDICFRLFSQKVNMLKHKSRVHGS